MLGLKLNHISKRGLWWRWAITWTNDNMLWSPSPNSSPKHTSMLVPKFKKQPLFAESGQKNPSVFQLKLLILRSNKTSFFSSKIRFFSLYKLKYPIFVNVRMNVSNPRHLSMYIVFFITCNVCLIFKYIYVFKLNFHRNSNFFSGQNKFENVSHCIWKCHLQCVSHCIQASMCKFCYNLESEWVLFTHIF